LKMNMYETLKIPTGPTHSFPGFLDKEIYHMEIDTSSILSISRVKVFI
jgi:hypothetical protein